MLSGNGVKTQRRSYDGLHDPRRITMLSGNRALFHFAHHAGMEILLVICIVDFTVFISYLTGCFDWI